MGRWFGVGVGVASLGVGAGALQATPQIQSADQLPSTYTQNTTPQAAARAGRDERDAPPGQSDAPGAGAAAGGCVGLCFVFVW